METSEEASKSGSLAGKLQWVKKLSLYEWVVIDLMVLAMIGVVIHHFAPAKSYAYWLVMVPVFGIACIVLEWSRARVKGKSGWTILQDQLVHWAGVLAAIYLIYLLRKTEQLSDTNSALVILLILALATFLAGIQLGWRLYILGGFLGAIFVLSTFLIDFMWVLIVAGLVLIGGYVYWRVQIRGEKGLPEQP